MDKSLQVSLCTNSNKAMLKKTTVRSRETSALSPLGSSVLPPTDLLTPDFAKCSCRGSKCPREFINFAGQASIKASWNTISPRIFTMMHRLPSTWASYKPSLLQSRTPSTRHHGSLLRLGSGANTPRYVAIGVKTEAS
jgi:hypothetical protein